MEGNCFLHPATVSWVPYAAAKSTINNQIKNISTTAIKKIRYELEISASDFFDTDACRNLE